jgi:hypothetical protein
MAIANPSPLLSCPPPSSAPAPSLDRLADPHELRQKMGLLGAEQAELHADPARFAPAHDARHARFMEATRKADGDGKLGTERKALRALDEQAPEAQDSGDTPDGRANGGGAGDGQINLDASVTALFLHEALGGSSNG